MFKAISRHKEAARERLADFVNRFVVIADEVEQALRSPEDETSIRAIVRQRDELQDEIDCRDTGWRRKVESLESTIRDGKAENKRFSDMISDLRRKLIACQNERDRERANAQRYLTDAGTLQRALLDSQAEVTIQRQRGDNASAALKEYEHAGSLAELVAFLSSLPDRTEQADTTAVRFAIRLIRERSRVVRIEGASEPEPPPKNEGAAVPPALIGWLRRTAGRDRGDNGRTAGTIRGEAIEPVLELIRARTAYGIAKYGQPLRLKDGRNTIEDALQEAGDLLQYLFKARLNGEDVAPLAPVMACIECVRIAGASFFSNDEGAYETPAAEDRAWKSSPCGAFCGDGSSCYLEHGHDGQHEYVSTRNTKKEGG